jgi:hypothetical protein
MDALTAQAPPTTVQAASASDSGVAAASPRPKTERIAYIDMARGLFLILMASTHAMTLAGIPATSPLADWGLPRGWATTGLIMLCGFMVATFAREMQERARIRHRVLRRAKQVLLVMFASNVLMVVVKRVVTHETNPLFSLDWWVGLLFFRSESSISGVLLPIALFLLVSPLLVALYDGCRSKVYGVTLTAGLLFFVALTWSVQALAADGHGTHDALSAMFGAGAGGFPVIPMVASGALGFLVGIVWQAPRERLDGRTTLGIVMLFVGTSQLLSTVPMILAPFVARTLMDVSHLLLILMLAMVITQWEPSQRGLRFIPVLGRFSLLTFLAHRVVEQTLAQGLRPFHLPGELVYAVCLGGGVFGSLAFILLRRRFAGYDRVLRAVYL